MVADIQSLVRPGWQQVSFAADCLGADYLGADELGDTCSICELDYCDECQCPGPTQDGVEYATFSGILYGKFIEANAESERRVHPV